MFNPVAIVGAFALAASLIGCASPSGGPVRVPIDLREIGAASVPSPPPRLELRDLRPAGALERTTIGGLSLGRVEIDPPEFELTRRLLLARIAARQTSVPSSAGVPISATLQQFAVITPATALYWDVTADLRVSLAVEGRERGAEARAVERTYVYPSAELIRRVTTRAMQRLGEQVDTALADLLTQR